MRGWIETTETGDRAELDVEPPDAVWAEIAVGADRCLGRRCAFVGRVLLRGGARAGRPGGALIANHALYFADLGLRSRATRPAILPEHDAVVFDEAHRLEESAASWLGGRVGRAGAPAGSLRDADRACREADVPAPARALDRVERAGACGCCARSRRPAAAGGCARCPPSRPRARRAARASSPSALEGGGDEIDAVAGRVAAARRRRRRVSRGGRPTTASSGPSPTCSPGRRSTSARRSRSCSGTTGRPRSSSPRRCRPASDFGFVRERLGLREARRGRRRLAVRLPLAGASLPAARHLPDPRADGAVERVAEEVAALCRLSAGRALVLTSSYRALDAVAAGDPRARPVRRARAGRGAARAAARALPRGGRLRARRHLDVLAGDRRARASRSRCS